MGEIALLGHQGGGTLGYKTPYVPFNFSKNFQKLSFSYFPTLIPLSLIGGIF